MFGQLSFFQCMSVFTISELMFDEVVLFHTHTHDQWLHCNFFKISALASCRLPRPSDPGTLLAPGKLLGDGLDSGLTCSLVWGWVRRCRLTLVQ